MKNFLSIFIITIVTAGIIIFNNLHTHAAAYSAPKNLKMNLDSNWELAYFKMSDKQWIAEYGIKGEDVINFKWKKLITVNCIDMPSAVTAKIYTLNFKKLLESQAKQMNSSLFFSDMGLSKTEEWFIWSIYGRNETEMSRVFIKNGKLYHMHYATKKPKFEKAEFQYALSALRKIQVN